VDSPFQKQSRFRKLTYGGLIVALFTATLLHRNFWLQPRADRLDLREQKLGEAELTGSVINLTLTGSRGLALVLLWDSAVKMQQRRQWGELDLTVSAITRLQPHYTGPWLWHSWNLAYNVPADCVRVEDKYFWIARGIQLLADGQRQNRDSPDLRYFMGVYYQNKFGVFSDEANVLRSLFQLSCMKPEDRDPARLRDGRGRVHLERFEEFCRRHPQLVRRLREVQGLDTPEKVVNYLAAHRDIPTYYPARQFEPAFPILPAEGPRATAGTPPLGDDFDNFAAARLWFTYAQEPLPPPQPWGPPTAEDRARYRLPKGMSLIIFRQSPAHAQTYAAEFLEKEGWFDEGWEIDAGRVGAERWFARPVVVGDARGGAKNAWARAADLWDKHGRENGLLLDAEVLQEKEKQAAAYREAYGVGPRELDRNLREEDLPAEFRESFRAHRQLVWYQEQLRIGGFVHFWSQAHALKTDAGSTARKLFARARKAHLANDDRAALRLYEEGFALWKQMLNDPAHVHYRHDIPAQAETYQVQAEYLRLVVAEERGEYQWLRNTGKAPEGARYTAVKPLLLLLDFAAQGVRAPGATVWLPPSHVIPPDRLGSPFVGPFGGDAADGKPFITDEAIRRARGRPDFQDPYLGAGK